MEKIKVFNVLTGNLINDGITISQKELVKNINLENYEYFFIANEKSDEDIINELIQSGCKIIFISNRKSYPVRYFFSLIREIKKINPNIVHVHGSSSLMFIELLAAKIAGINVRIAHSRNTKSNYKKLDKFFRPLFNKLYTHALACGNDAGKWLFGEGEFEIIHNGKDLTKFKYNKLTRDKLRRKLKIDDKIVIGHVGAFNYQKNHEFILKVFYEFTRTHNKTILYLIGEGKNKDLIKKQAKELGIQDQIQFVGTVQNVQDYLQTMDIMIFPSRFEGLPNVVLEWQAMGLPCIISDNITKECIVSDFVTSVSINENENVWSNKIEQMLYIFSNRTNQAERGIIGLKNHGFDIKDTAKHIESVYFNSVKKTYNT